MAPELRITPIEWRGGQEHLKHSTTLPVRSDPSNFRTEGVIGASSLTPAQCSANGDQFQPTTTYLVKLRKRMIDTGFPRDDVLYAKAGALLDAMRELTIEHRREPTALVTLGKKTK